MRRVLGNHPLESNLTIRPRFPQYHFRHFSYYLQIHSFIHSFIQYLQNQRAKIVFAFNRAKWVVWEIVPGSLALIYWPNKFIILSFF
ncbi:hypothetical protein HanRHA438_Chr17g0826841 [Helianthus annuus]|nr:hypothetical protein HanRHA438_Chr17g0826841 [Helianthus annuus]